MEDIDGLAEPHGINGAERVAVKVIDHFQYAGTAISSQRFRIDRLAAHLRLEQSQPHTPFHVIGKGT